VQFADVGFPVIGFDVWEEKIKQREAGSGAGSDVTDEHLAETIAKKQISFTTDFSQLSKCQCIVICVPTPLSKFRTPDLSYIVSAMDEVVKHLQPDTMIVLESTTYPGCTDELISRRVEKDSGLVVGDNVFVSFSPERVDPGNKDFDLRYTPKVMGGATPNCWTVTSAMYKTVVQNLVGVDSTKEAELVKLLENTFRAVNIGMVNELAHMADRMGVNIWNVINAAKSKPFGFMAFYPGPGIGGHCIPLDPQYLSYTAKTYNHYSRFIELASDVNENMPEFW
jgi:UDP-N-acetyl-D-glucosamine dehydrogenase